MKWSIPAKTFLMGEYVALMGGPAIITLTTPCFTMTRTASPGLQGIHPESPAGKFWQAQGLSQGLRFDDPYAGLGGLGASSAQFVGVYLAANQGVIDRQVLLHAYQAAAWSGQGMPPSGYDVLAQTQTASQYVYIHQATQSFEVFDWPFDKLEVVLLHTGEKCQTHRHLELLETLTITGLADLVEQAKSAFDNLVEQALINAINGYHDTLCDLNLMSPSTDEKVRALRRRPDVLAAKGCGALGVDVILLLVKRDEDVI